MRFQQTYHPVSITYGGNFRLVTNYGFFRSSDRILEAVLNSAGLSNYMQIIDPYGR